MLGFENPELLKIGLTILLIGLGWIVLRFLLKLARKIFMTGCVSIVLIGLILIASQYLQGV